MKKVPKPFMRFVTAMRTDEPHGGVYLINMNECADNIAGAVRLKNGRPGGFPCTVDLSQGKWIVNCDSPDDPSGSLQALVVLAGESRGSWTKAELAAFPDVRPQWYEVFREKWAVALEWDGWNARGLQNSERMIEMHKMGFVNFKDQSPKTFRSMWERLGLKIVKV